MVAIGGGWGEKTYRQREEGKKNPTVNFQIVVRQNILRRCPGILPPALAFIYKCNSLSISGTRSKPWCYF